MLELSKEGGVTPGAAVRWLVEERVQQLVVNDPADKRGRHARIVEGGVNSNEAVRARVTSKPNRAVAIGAGAAPRDAGSWGERVKPRSESVHDVVAERREVVELSVRADAMGTIGVVGHGREFGELSSERGGAPARWFRDKQREGAFACGVEENEAPTDPHDFRAVGPRVNGHEARAVVGPLPTQVRAQLGRDATRETGLRFFVIVETPEKVQLNRGTQ
ncbi:MAG: hypothetical protein HYY84_06195 [Deltaproteobacteria bacterium]|nr:hypothetical protein [Deltaproteobacteria bacterium]